MSKFVILLIFAFIAISSSAIVPVEELKPNVLVVTDIEKFKSENPDLILTPLKSSIVEPIQAIRYTLGNRVSGDRLVAQGSNSQSWGAAQNVRLAVQYPTSGTGAIVSFVDILVDQSSNQGQGYVAGGGIGQRQILVVIEAYNTTYFKYVAQIFGY